MTIEELEKKVQELEARLEEVESIVSSLDNERFGSVKETCLQMARSGHYPPIR
jgi:hypothetical protein